MPNFITFKDKIFIKVLLECCLTDEDIIFKDYINKLSCNDEIFRIFTILHSQKMNMIIYNLEVKQEHYDKIYKTIKNVYSFIEYLKMNSEFEENWKLNKFINTFFVYVDNYNKEEFWQFFLRFIKELADLQCDPHTRRA